MEKDLLLRLKSLTSLSQIPVHELEWLVQHGNPEIHQPGLIASKGARVEYLWIILEGHIAVYIDRGAGPKSVNTELYAGSVTGMLPYSRLSEIPGDLHAEERTEIFTVSTRHFPEMINKCPAFTAHTVHTMIDRTRIHTTGALQDEKMIAMGKLAAGLAHELNNPASVNIRNAKLMKESLAEARLAARQLLNAGLSEKQFDAIESLCSECIERAQGASLSPIEKYDLHYEMTQWLEQNQVNAIHADPLADLEITIEELNKMRDTLPENAFETAISWITANYRLHALSDETGEAANRIYNLVTAVKKFTYMDNLDERELIDIEASICDSVKVLEAKSGEKKADIRLEIDNALPRVSANGAELNQVWFSLLDNALDAIPESGQIKIRARMEGNFIVVRIIDNGPGIPREQRDRIFDPFYTTKPPGHGTGLGLDLSRRIIRRYKGDIHVHSETGNTEFRITLSPAASGNL